MDEKKNISGDAEQLRIVRVLRWFRRSDDELAGSAHLRAVPLARLQEIFGIEPSDPMYDCYRVTDARRADIQTLVDVPIRLSEYEYFVEADQIRDD